jgi:hypothetical protein
MAAGRVNLRLWNSGQYLAMFYQWWQYISFTRSHLAGKCVFPGYNCKIQITIALDFPIRSCTLCKVKTVSFFGDYYQYSHIFLSRGAPRRFANRDCYFFSASPYIKHAYRSLKHDRVKAQLLNLSHTWRWPSRCHCRDQLRHRTFLGVNTWNIVKSFECTLKSKSSLATT